MALATNKQIVKMKTTNTDIQKALRIKRAVNEYFETSAQTKVLAKSLMPFFIEKGFFTKNSKDGLPIRDFLKKLEENKHLYLIPQAVSEKKDATLNWYFIKPVVEVIPTEETTPENTPPTE